MDAPSPLGLQEAQPEVVPLVVAQHSRDDGTIIPDSSSPRNTNDITAHKQTNTAQALPVHGYFSPNAPLSSPSGSTQDARPAAMTRVFDGQHFQRCPGAYISPTGTHARHSDLIPSDMLDSAPPLTIVSSRALAIHLTKLRCNTMRGRPFRIAADRAIRLLLEEALAWAPIQHIEVVLANNVRWTGVSSVHPTCAIVMGERGYPLLEVFRTIQPESPTGFLTLKNNDAENVCNNHSSLPTASVSLHSLSVPVAFQHCSVFLLDAACGSSVEACVAIRSLLAVGVHESNVFFVTLMISAAAVTSIYESFPSVHIVTAGVAPDATERGDNLLGLDSFQERYFETTTIHQSDLGPEADL